MESRRPVHYKRNTVEPHIGQKCKDMVRENAGRIFYTDENGKLLWNPNKNFHKVVAGRICNWCDHDMGGYRTICPECHNCQYCGFYSPVLNQCLECGNQAPDDIKVKVQRVKVRDIKREHPKKDDIM